MASVIAGTAVATVVTWWLARNGLMLAAVVAGGLVALDSELVQLSQISRFYAVQQLAFFVAAIAFARAVEMDRPFRTIALAVVAGAGFALALHLQIITIVGMGGLIAFAVLWPESYLNRRGRDWFQRYPVGFSAVVIGLFGTIVGLITAFRGVSKADPAEKADLLSRGISEALNCTAFGLLTAIVAITAYGYFQVRIERTINDMVESSMNLMNLVVSNRDKMKEN